MPFNSQDMFCAASIYLHCDWMCFWVMLMFTQNPSDTSFPGSMHVRVKGCLSIILCHGLEVWDEAEGKWFLVTKWTHKPIVYGAYGSTLKMSCPKFWRVLELFRVHCWLQISAVSEKRELFSFKVCSVICGEMGHRSLHPVLVNKNKWKELICNVPLDKNENVFKISHLRGKRLGRTWQLKMWQFVVTWTQIFIADEFNYIQHPVIWFYSHDMKLQKDRICPFFTQQQKHLVSSVQQCHHHGYVYCLCCDMRNFT